MSAADFDWYRDENVAVPAQAGIAVYENVRGNVAIRQQGDWCAHEDDIVIEVRPENVRKLVDSLLALIEPDASASTLVLPAPMTPAERQRRHRHAKRHVSVTGSVTPTVTVTEAVTPCARNGALFPD